MQGLNLINAFSFRASTENSENAKFIAKLIIERATGRKVEQIMQKYGLTEEKAKSYLNQ